MRRKFLLPLIGIISVVVCSAGHAGGVVCDAPNGIPAAQIILLGEPHGTMESPALVGKVVCAYAKMKPVALGLELPAIEQRPIDDYLASNGDSEAAERLLAGQFWTGTDGRSSRAMFELIRYVRGLKQQGLPVSVFTLIPAQLGNTADDNPEIAHVVRAFHRKNPTVRIVALMGNLHAGQTKVSPFGKTITPAGYLLRDLHPTSILITHHPGTIWACTDSCGIHHVAGDRSQTIGFHNDAPMRGYSMSYMLPSITASPPAGVAVKKHPGH